MPTAARSRRHGALRSLLSVLLVGQRVRRAAVVQAAINPASLTATLGAQWGPGGVRHRHPDAEPDHDRACFVADAVTLTNFEGDPPTFVGINDTRLSTDVTKIWFPATFDANGDDTGCTTTTADRMDDILDHATDYAAVIYTAGFGDLAAAGGRLTYPYETATLDVTTRLCPYAIRTEATLLGNEDQCDPIVLAVHDVAGDHPGYSDVNYGGVKAYDHLVTDAMSLDATVSDASLQGVSGACDAGSLVCDWDGLRYRFANAARGPVSIKPTLPGGMRLGPVVADVPASVAGGTINLDMSGGDAAATVYLFYATDTTAPVVKAPVVRLTTGGTYSSSAAVSVTWSGSDAGTGIQHYTIQRRIGTGAYVTVGHGSSATSLSSTVPRGSSSLHRFRVRGMDIAGNISAWVYSASSELVVVEDTSSSVRYGGAWSTQTISTASGGKLHHATVAGRRRRA